MIRQRSGRKILEVGVVRWAAISRDDAPECGIERLRGSVRKVTIQQQSDQATERNGLLILLRNKSGLITTRLVAPSSAISMNSEIHLIAVGHHEPAHADVRQLLQRSRNIEVFDVQVIEP